MAHSNPKSYESAKTELMTCLEDLKGISSKTEIFDNFLRQSSQAQRQLLADKQELITNSQKLAEKLTLGTRANKELQALLKSETANTAELSKQYDMKVSELSQQIEVASKRYKNLKAKVVEKFQPQYNRAIKKLKESQTIKTSMQTKIVELQEKCGQLTRDLESASKFNQQSIEQFSEKLKEDIKTSTMELSNKLHQSLSTNRELQQENNKKQERVTQLEAEMRSLADAHALKIRQQQEQFKAMESTHLEQIDSLKQELSDHSYNVQSGKREAHAKIEELNNRWLRAEKQLNQTRQDRNDMAISLEKTEKQRDELIDQVKSLTTKNARLEGERSAENSNENLKSSILRVHREVQDSSKAVEEKVDGLSQQIETISTDRVEGKIEGLSRKLGKLANRSVENKIDKMNKKMKQLNTSSQDIYDKMDHMADQDYKNGQTINKLQKSTEQAVRSVHQLSTTADQTINKIIQVQRNQKSLSEQIHDEITSVGEGVLASLKGEEKVDFEDLMKQIIKATAHLSEENIAALDNQETIIDMIQEFRHQAKKARLTYGQSGIKQDEMAGEFVGLMGANRPLDV